jgi:hypothetical protein
MFLFITLVQNATKSKPLIQKPVNYKPISVLGCFQQIHLQYLQKHHNLQIPLNKLKMFIG